MRGGTDRAAGATRAPAASAQQAPDHEWRASRHARRVGPDRAREPRARRSRQIAESAAREPAQAGEPIAARRATVCYTLDAMARVTDPFRSGALRVAGSYASYTWRFS